MLLRSAALISLISVSANTPKTFEYVPSLMYVTFAVDIMVACLLTVEMITKMCIQGLVAPSTSQVSLKFPHYELLAILWEKN